MFHFPASPPAPYELQTRVTPHNGRRVPPFGNPRITARKPAPRGISQATTSFIGPQCQGIHRTLITTNTHKHTNKFTITTHKTRDNTHTPDNKRTRSSRGTRRPATTRTHPTQPRKEKTGKEGEDGTTGGGPRTTKHQHRNPSNPTTRVRRSFTYYRCSRPLCSSQPTRPHPPHNSLRRGCSAQGAPPQNPTACHAPHPQKHNQRKPLRKEVIQPHLPVRLPCYDFVPITGPAFDRSP